MKSKNNPKKKVDYPDKFDRKSSKGKSLQKLKNQKRKPSIYDDFDDEDDL